MSTPDVRQVTGDVIGAGIDGAGNIVGKSVTINGSVIQLINPSAEALAALQKVNAITTAVEPTGAGGMQGSTTVHDSRGLQRSIDELLGLLKSAGQPHQQPQQIQAGNVQFSRAELLLKKAVLIKADAEQMYFDHLEKQKPRNGQHRHDLPGGHSEIDLNAMFADFDEDAHTARLQEAYKLLEEANQLDPTNTDVLLNLAQLLIDLTPDDPTDEQRLLNRIQNLLSAPRNDTERFRLAQTRFLLATRSEPPHEESLRDARQMFAQLGRREWVRQCDDLLSSSSARQAAPPGAIPPPLFQSQSPAAHPTPPFPPPPGPGAQFQPVGRWLLQIADGRESVITTDLFPNGTFSGVQHSGPYVPPKHAQGHWLYNPYHRLLQFQGVVNNFIPFMLGIAIQHAYPNGFYGTGTDGCAYFIRRP